MRYCSDTGEILVRERDTGKILVRDWYNASNVMCESIKQTRMWTRHSPGHEKGSCRLWLPWGDEDEFFIMDESAVAIHNGNNLRSAGLEWPTLWTLIVGVVSKG